MASIEIKPEDYLKLLSEKTQSLETLFATHLSHATKPALEIFASSPTHYRMRAEFRIWHDKEDMYYYMFDAVTKERIRVDQFLPATKLINEVMPLLIENIKNCQILRTKLFQVDFLSTQSGEILVTLLYHKKLEGEWIEKAKELKSKLEQKFKLHLIGRARKQKIEIDQDFVIERIKVKEKELIYKQVENSFTQPNAGVATKMLEWAQDITRNSQGDLLELYCGNGNFSIALAGQFRKVLATELAGPSVEAAQYNIEVNGVDNLQIIRMSAEEFADAMKGTRAYQRLKGIDLKSYECNTILVDPPRAGLDEQAVNLVQQYENIIYISCNPLTLLDNLKVLSATHEIQRFALFDQFPYTHHAEAGVYLVRKK